MSEGLRIYAGTQAGLHAWRARNGDWEPVSQGEPRGIIEALAVCRQHPERAFAGVVKHGLYRTTDGGRHWNLVFHGDVRSVDVDPTDDAVIYAGTEPVHLYRSENSGETWEELTGLQDLPESVRRKWEFPLPPHEGHTIQTFVHPDDPNLLHVCIEHGGIVRSKDRGQTWEDVSEGIDYLDIHMLANAPGRFDRFFVASARGFYTAPDPADGWVRAENGCTRNYFHDFVFLPPANGDAAPTMLIATADRSPGYWPAAAQSRGMWLPHLQGSRSAVFRSHDLAESWERVGEGLPEEINPMLWSLVRHPTDPDTVFGGFGEVARGYAFGIGGSGAVVVSRDRGDHWESLDLPAPAIRKLAVVPD